MWHQGTTIWKVNIVVLWTDLVKQGFHLARQGANTFLGEVVTAWGLGLQRFASRLDALRIKQSSFSKIRNRELVMVWGQGLCGLLAPDPKNPTLPTMWSYCYQFQSNGSNILEIPCIPLVQHYLINLILSLFHCIIVSAGFMEFPHFPPFPL